MVKSGRAYCSVGIPDEVTNNSAKSIVYGNFLAVQHEYNLPELGTIGVNVQRRLKALAEKLLELSKSGHGSCVFLSYSLMSALTMKASIL